MNQNNLHSIFHRPTMVVATILSIAVIGINLLFVVNAIESNLSGLWWQYLLITIGGIFYFSLILYLVVFLVYAFGFTKVRYLPVSYTSNNFNSWELKSSYK